MSFVLLPCLWVWFLCGAAFAFGHYFSARPRTAQAILNNRKPARPRPTPKPATPHNCPDCSGSHATIAHPVPAWLKRLLPPPWRSTLKPGGRPKRIDSHGRFCPNPLCAYGGIADATVHALVADGRRHGVQIRQCQTCGHHVVNRFGTFLYRRRKPLALIQAVLSDLWHGSGIRRPAEVHAISPQTVLAWLAAFGTRTKAMACSVVHQLKALLSDGCVPGFCSDGLMHYFYALTAHFGQWLPSPHGRSNWQVFSLLLYAQVVKR